MVANLDNLVLTLSYIPGLGFSVTRLNLHDVGVGHIVITNRTADVKTGLAVHRHRIVHILYYILIDDLAFENFLAATDIKR